LRSDSLRYASLGTRCGRVGLFALKRSFRLSVAATPAPLNPNDEIATLINFSKGDSRRCVFARLRVARANRAVTLFAMFRFVFCPTLFSDYLRCLGATPTPTLDHPPLKSVEFFILFAFHAGFYQKFHLPHSPKTDQYPNALFRDISLSFPRKKRNMQR